MATTTSFTIAACSTLTTGHAVELTQLTTAVVTGQHVVVTVGHTVGHLVGHAVGHALGHCIVVATGHVAAAAHDDVPQLVACAVLVAGQPVDVIELDPMDDEPYVCAETPIMPNSESATNTAKIAKILFLMFTSFSSNLKTSVFKCALTSFCAALSLRCIIRKERTWQEKKIVL